MPDTIAAMIAEVNAAGYYFNNLFQLQDGSWRCNLRSEVMTPSWSQFGNGPDPATAVAETLAKLQAEKPKFRPKALLSDDPDISIPEFLKRHRPVIDPDKEREADAIAQAAGLLPDAMDLIGGAPAQADDLI